MLGTNMTIFEMAAFFVGENENSFGFRSQMQLCRLRNALAQNDAFFDFAAHGFDRDIFPKRKKSCRKSFVLAHQTEQDMFGRDYLRTVLQGFITGEKNDSTG